ncbi:MAG: hypothetical protein M1834_001024 [Cirrosporium novae-zelandiae]|nr:MAG: hypothetical protein M1834_001024 [Cirrosporium novae-zelandiae]
MGISAPSQDMATESTTIPSGTIPDDEFSSASRSSRSPLLAALSFVRPLSRDSSLSRRWNELVNVGRYTLGILLLLTTVLLWTASNFLASTIFADDSYSKPFFVTYVNTAFFIIPLLPYFMKKAYEHSYTRSRSGYLSIWNHASKAESLAGTGDEDGAEGRLARRSHVRGGSYMSTISVQPLSRRQSLSSNFSGPLDLKETAKLSLEFSILWFAANYFVAACLKYTTVASSTILTSTSSIWTLLFGAMIRVEHFTIRKLLGVLASLLGIMVISLDDLSSSPDKDRGSFPDKTFGEIALGDAMAFFSAVLYGVYSILLKKRIGDESRVNMPLFFAFVGLWNVVLLWPGIIILHVTGEEPFALPPTTRIWTIVLVNSVTSLVSDLCWAYATLLSSPLVVTVGLSLTIPLSLIGEILIRGQYSSMAYWIGAAVVFISFIFVNHEESVEEKKELVGQEVGSEGEGLLQPGTREDENIV